MNKITADILRNKIKKGLTALLDKDWDFVAEIIGPNYLLYVSLDVAVDCMPIAELKTKLTSVERKLITRSV